MQQGFWKSLFDFSFTSFVTPRAVKVLYGLSLLLLTLLYLWIGIEALSGPRQVFVEEAGGEITVPGSGGDSQFAIIWFLLLGPLVVFFYTLFCRVFFEFLVVLFRLYEVNRESLALQKLVHPDAAAQLGRADG